MATLDGIDANPGAEYPFGDHLVTLTPWTSPTYDGRAIATGGWVHASIGPRSLGLIQCASPSRFFAFDPARVGRALGDETDTLDDAVTKLLRFVA